MVKSEKILLKNDYASLIFVNDDGFNCGGKLNVLDSDGEFFDDIYIDTVPEAIEIYDEARKHFEKNTISDLLEWLNLFFRIGNVKASDVEDIPCEPEFMNRFGDHVLYYNEHNFSHYEIKE